MEESPVDGRVAMPPRNTTPLPGSKNVHLSVNGSKLYIYCDLSKDFGRSSSGKSTIIATSSGSKPLGATNAFLGLNMFCKSLTERSLDDEAVAELHEMVAFGRHCQWQIEGCTLCLLIDFANVTEWAAGSGKSMLLASSNGNKGIGKTGIFCGMNCYVPLGRKFQMEEMSSICGKSSFSVGDKVDLGNGFVVHLESDTEVTVHHEFLRKNMTEIITMPAFYLNNDLVLTMLIKLNNKKAKLEENDVREGGSGFVEASSKSKNLLVRCNEVDGTVYVDVRFDPTQNCGLSSKGKTMKVSSSGGWCEVSHGVFINFNANRSLSPLTSVEVTTAVSKVFEGRNKSELMSLSLKTVMQEVLKELGVQEGDMESLKEQVKLAVVEYLQSSSK